MSANESPTYDDIVNFGHVLAGSVFNGDEDPTASLLSYFEKPHKWEREYQQWRKLGGTLDRECLEAFEDWYDKEN